MAAGPSRPQEPYTGAGEVGVEDGAAFPPGAVSENSSNDLEEVKGRVGGCG